MGGKQHPRQVSCPCAAANPGVKSILNRRGLVKRPVASDKRASKADFGGFRWVWGISYGLLLAC